MTLGPVFDIVRPHTVINITRHMRTKTLLLTAALTAASSLATMAQVYSVNIVGYINLHAPPKFSMIANQLNNSPDNTLVNLLPSVPENTQVFKFDKVAQSFTASFFSADNPGWSDGTFTLNPGEGCFFYVDPAFAAGGADLTFVGEVQLNSSLSVDTKFQVLSSVIPQSDVLDNLGYTPRENDQVYRFDPVAQSFNAYFWSADNPGWSSNPVPNVGESFFLYADPAFGGSRTWVRNFSVGP